MNTLGNNQTIVGLLCLVLLCALPACHNGPKEANKYQRVIDTWVVEDATNPPPQGGVLFIGSSSIRLWESLHEDFPQYHVIQRGFGGSTFADANLYIDKIVTPYRPRAIVVFEGSNDIASGKSADQVFRDYKRFVKLIRRGEPDDAEPADILFIGITPTESRWEKWPEMQKLNRMVMGYTQRHHATHYIDTPTPILATAPQPDGPPSRELFRKDLLHLSPAGYALWTRVITPKLQAVCPPTQTATPNDLP